MLRVPKNTYKLIKRTYNGSECTELNRRLNRLHRLISHGRLYSISPKQIIQSSDDRFRPLINLIKSGFVKKYGINNDGTIAVQAIYGPGDIFPLTLAYKLLVNHAGYDSPEIIYYEALSAAEVYSIDAQILADAAVEQPSIYKDLFIESGFKANSNTQRLENISLKDSLKRTAHQISYYARLFGEILPDGVRIKIGLTHQDLADILCLARETVSINIRELRRKNLIKTGNQHIEIPDLKELERLAFGR